MHFSLEVNELMMGAAAGARRRTFLEECSHRLETAIFTELVGPGLWALETD